jgi:hypothetical protein
MNVIKQRNKKLSIKRRLDTMTKYITAFDPTIKKRVLFMVKNGWAISVITGYKFRYKGK